MSTTTTFAATEFDRPTPRLPLPGSVTSGTQPELQLVDGLTRGDKVVGRFETSPGLFAVKLAPAREPLRVTVRLAADVDTAAWWEQRVPEHVEPRAPYGPRLLAVRSQGETRGAVLLARKPEDFDWRAKARFSFELSPDELPDDGFLVLEATDVVAAAPSWATQVAGHGAVGVRVDTVEVTPVAELARPVHPGLSLDGSACERLGLVAAGGGAGNQATVDVRAGFFLTHPPPGLPGPVTWTLRPRLVSTVRPDPIPTATGPVIPKPATGEPPLSTRDKAFAVARHELTALDAQVRKKVRHVAVRGLRRASRPLDDGLAPRACADLLTQGLVRAVLIPLGSTERLPCTVAMAPGGRVTVSCADPPAGPAVVYVGAPGATGGMLGRTADARLRWRLLSVRFGRGRG